MSHRVEVTKGKTLEFVHDVSLRDLGNAAAAYSSLLVALTGAEPSWQEFTDFLQREGYAKPVESYSNVSPKHK
jgi:hypothetical protein